MKNLRFILALWIGKIVAFISSHLLKGHGTNLPGAIANKIQKDFIKNFKNIPYENAIIVTGTNGKSTSNNLIVHVLESAGKTVATNIEGANLIGGIATALIKNATWTGKVNRNFICFEIDERSLPRIYPYFPAKNICITNIQKDQVQRNGEPDFIYQKIKSILKKDTTLFLNNDEPRSKSLEDMCEKVVYFGVNQNDSSFEKKDFYDVTMPCPKCNHKIHFDYYNVDNIGKFHCEHCGFQSEKNISYCISKVDFQNHTFQYNNHTYSVPYNQPFFIYNCALSIAVAKHFKIPEKHIKKAFQNFKNIGGRLETISFHEKEIKYIRIKQENPETLQSAFDYIAKDKTPKIIMFGYGQLEDFKPFYTNTFYAFDCNINEMLNTSVEKCICFSEAIAYDTANRLIYAGFSKDKIAILPTENDTEILNELEKYESNNVYLITWLHKYELLKKQCQKEGDQNGK